MLQSRERPGLWRPLRTPIFRQLLIADVVSDIGTFMQGVGSAWLMVSIGAECSLAGWSIRDRFAEHTLSPERQLPMSQTLADAALDILFREARTYAGWQDRPV